MTTPSVWSIQEVQPKVKTIFVVDKLGDQVATCTTFQRAREVLRAYSSHEKLVASLKKMVEMVKNAQLVDRGYNAADIVEANNAIAFAERKIV